ncbi:MAG: hypothetical protein MJE68_02125 [Proteobacteria bacterium]|nr:hypothetical protein [Pseudomonadota bacterium]
MFQERERRAKEREEMEEEKKVVEEKEGGPGEAQDKEMKVCTFVCVHVFCQPKVKLNY